MIFEWDSQAAAAPAGFSLEGIDPAQAATISMDGTQATFPGPLDRLAGGAGKATHADATKWEGMALQLPVFESGESVTFYAILAAEGDQVLTGDSGIAAVLTWDGLGMVNVFITTIPDPDEADTTATDPIMIPVSDITNNQLVIGTQIESGTLRFGLFWGDDLSTPKALATATDGFRIRGNAETTSNNASLQSFDSLQFYVIPETTVTISMIPAPTVAMPDFSPFMSAGPLSYEGLPDYATVAHIRTLPEPAVVPVLGDIARQGDYFIYDGEKFTLKMPDLTAFLESDQTIRANWRFQEALTVEKGIVDASGVLFRTTAVPEVQVNPTEDGDVDLQYFTRTFVEDKTNLGADSGSGSLVLPEITGGASDNGRWLIVRTGLLGEALKKVMPDPDYTSEMLFEGSTIDASEGFDMNILCTYLFYTGSGPVNPQGSSSASARVWNIVVLSGQHRPVIRVKNNDTGFDRGLYLGNHQVGTIYVNVTDQESQEPMTVDLNQTDAGVRSLEDDEFTIIPKQNLGDTYRASNIVIRSQGNPFVILSGGGRVSAEEFTIFNVFDPIRFEKIGGTYYITGEGILSAPRPISAGTQDIVPALGMVNVIRPLNYDQISSTRKFFRLILPAAADSPQGSEFWMEFEEPLRSNSDFQYGHTPQVRVQTNTGEWKWDSGSLRNIGSIPVTPGEGRPRYHFMLVNGVWQYSPQNVGSGNFFRTTSLSVGGSTTLQGNYDTEIIVAQNQPAGQGVTVVPSIPVFSDEDVDIDSYRGFEGRTAYFFVKFEDGDDLRDVTFNGNATGFSSAYRTFGRVGSGARFPAASLKTYDTSLGSRTAAFRYTYLNPEIGFTIENLDTGSIEFV